MTTKRCWGRVLWVLESCTDLKSYVCTVSYCNRHYRCPSYVLPLTISMYTCSPSNCQSLNFLDSGSSLISSAHFALGGRVAVGEDPVQSDEINDLLWQPSYDWQELVHKYSNSLALTSERWFWHVCSTLAPVISLH